MANFALIALAAFVAGIVNALAGGGTFLTFPALVAAGLPPTAANASSTVALYPGYFVSAWAGRKSFSIVAGMRELNIPLLAGISLVGGLAGGLLLLYTPESAFNFIIPWLLGFATIVFAIGNFLPREVNTAWIGPRSVAVLQSFVAVYGGYFGGGVGLMMLAMLTFYGLRDIRALNVLKLVFVGLMNTAAVVAFVVAGAVHWPQALTMMVAGVIGGYAGGRLSGIINPRIIKVFVVIMGTALTVWFATRH